MKVSYDWETEVTINNIKIEIFFEYSPAEKGIIQHGLQMTPDFSEDIFIHTTKPQGYTKHPTIIAACWIAIKDAKENIF